MNKKILLVLLGVFFNFYFDLNCVITPRSPRKPGFGVDIDAQDPNTSTLFDKTTKDLETGFAKRRGPVSNIDPSSLSTSPQSPLTSGGPHAHPFGSLDEIVPDKPIDEITRQISFSDRMAERARNKEANKTAERLNSALQEGKAQNKKDLSQQTIEPPLSRDFYPEIISPGKSVEIETKVSEPLTPKEKNIETDWWGPVVDPRGSNQIDQIRKLQQAAPEQRIDQTPISPLTRNLSLSPMEEENVDKLSSLAGIPDLLKNKGKQSNLSVQTDLAGQEPQGSSSKKSSSKPKKKPELPKKPVQPENFKRNFGQVFLGKFNEVFGLQGGPEYANALEIVRRMATKDQFVETTPSVIDARKRLNAANKAFAQAVAKKVNGIGPDSGTVSELANKTNFSDDEMVVLLRNSKGVDQKIITDINQAKKNFDDAVKKETESYVQEAKNAFLESFLDVENTKKALNKAELAPGNGFLVKAVEKIKKTNLSEEGKQSIEALSQKKSLTDSDRDFISGILSPDDKVEFDGLRNAVARAKDANTQKLDSLLSSVPPEGLDEGMVTEMISRNISRWDNYGNHVLPQNQRKKEKVPASQQSSLGLLKESSFKSESEELGKSYLELKAITPKASQTLIPGSPTVESTKTKKPKSLDKKLSSPKKKTTSLEKQGDEEVLAEYARLAAETKTSRNNTQ